MRKFWAIVPPQRKGVASDTVYSVKKSTVREAKSLYRRAKNNLLNVNRWHELAGKLSADFQLTDTSGNEIGLCAQEGYYCRINVPAPGPAGQESFDWIRVERIEEHKPDGSNEWILIKVRPADSPVNPDGRVDHFFDDAATSNFCVKRNGKRVIAAVYGRNEIPNTESVILWNRIRNIIVGLAAMIGLNKPQWSRLVKGILTK